MVTGPSGPTPLASLNFVDNVYSVGGVSQTLAQVVSNTGRRSASGFSILAEQNPGGSPIWLQTPVTLLGLASTLYLTCNWSIVIEANLATEALGNRVYYLYALPANDVDDTVLLWSNGGDSELSDENGIAINVDLFSDGFASVAGTYTFRFTRTDANAGVSFDGQPVDTPDGTSSVANPISGFFSPLTHVYIGTGLSNVALEAQGFIRKITFYAAQTDAVLPTLTV